MNKERLITTGASALGLLAVSQFAFSKSTRLEIGERDGWECQETGKRFADGWMLHAAHYDHDRDNPDYDEAYNGRMLSVGAHKDHHVDHQGRAHEIGLSEPYNDLAIEALKHTEHRTIAWLKAQFRFLKG